MKYYFVSHCDSPNLILIFAGWGMDEKPFHELNSIVSAMIIPVWILTNPFSGPIKQYVFMHGLSAYGLLRLFFQIRHFP